jgi:two-component system LytT family response regulator
MRSITAVIIEDEIETIQKLKQFSLENNLIIEVIAFAVNIKESIEVIKEHKPELIFINTTEENLENFNLFLELDFNLPKLVFMSGEVEYAYKAIKLNAIDFLQKPLNVNDFIISIYKTLKMIEMEQVFQNQKIQQINTINSLYQSNDYVAIASIDKIELLKIDDIVYCKAEGKYTEFHLSNGKKILSSKNLGEYKNILESGSLFRIHHSYVINIKHITKITKKDGYYCELINGDKLPIAKRRQDEFLKFIKL